MVATHVIKTKVTSDIKARVHAEAERELLTESLWLRRAVHAALGGTRPAHDVIGSKGITESPGARVHHEQRRAKVSANRTRLSIRLRHGDRLILQERAQGRGMPTATYVAVLVRAHLRALAPLPREELAGLKRSTAELSALGRNLNQIARAANQGGRVALPGRAELQSMLQICEAMREHVKSLVRVNTASWEVGHAEANS